MSSTVTALREALKVPGKGRIDFQGQFGSSLGTLFDRFHQGHFPVPKEVVHKLGFDDVVATHGPDYAEIIDTRYLATDGVSFQAYRHTYDWATQLSGFEPLEAHYYGNEHPYWVEPHVYAVADHGTPADYQALSKPNCLNVNNWSGEVASQLMTPDHAIRINFQLPACAVKIRCDYRIHFTDKGKPIYNWPQMLAYDAAGTLLDQDEAPYGGTLEVSSWANDIAYVMVTVNNHWAGVEPYGVFDDLEWTTVEFVLRVLKKLREAPPPVPRGALVDQVLHRLQDLELAQQRLQDRLAGLGENPAAEELGRALPQLRAGLAALQEQAASLQAFYRKLTQHTANRSSAAVAAPPA